MNGEHSASPRREGRRKKGSSRDMDRLLRTGWVILGLLLALSVGLLLWLVFKPSAVDAPPAAPAAPSAALPVDPGPAGSAFTGSAPVMPSGDGQSGRSVEITGFDCDFEVPREVTLGRLDTLDLSQTAQQLCDNVRAAGWGECFWSVTENGSLLLRPKDPVPLSAADYDKQTAFLESSQPENMARTFLENSRLIPLLRACGLYMSTAAENNGGEISFHGVGDVPGTECTAKFAFLFTGAFNQAVIRATSLMDAVTTDRVVSLNTAARRAVTWNPEGEGPTRVTAVELRHVRGIPFYVFTCADGGDAFALAVEEDALSAVPGAEDTYHELLAGGIQDNLVQPGAE